MDNIFDGYDYEKEYDCSKNKKCNHFSKIMFLIIHVNSIPNGHAILRNYVSTNKNEVNNKNSEGWTALHIAAINSNKYSLETVKLLLDNGADINLTTVIGSTALMLATAYSNKGSSLETVRLLLENGTNVNLATKDGLTALMLAAVYANTDSSLETVRLLLEKGADVNLVDKEGWTALMMAARYSNTDSSLETVKLLLEKGAYVNLVDEEG